MSIYSIELTGIQFGSTLAYFRHKQHLTQHFISASTGYSINKISQLERNKTTPTHDEIESLCNVLGIPFYVFVWEAKLATKSSQANTTAQALQPFFRYITEKLYCETEKEPIILSPNGLHYN